MKATDFRPEHFEKGRDFSRADFKAYVQASAKFAKTMYTRYLPCLAGGILVSFLFSQGIGGFIGNIMAVLCIFAGLIVGGVFNVKASKSVKEFAAKLGITNADVAAARRHIKDGTVAWSGGDETSVNTVESRAQADNAVTPQTDPQSIAAQAIPALSENPMRAVWAAGLMLAAWILMMIFQLAFGARLIFSGSAFVFLAVAILSAAVYLMAQPGKRYKLYSVGVGVAAGLLLACSTTASMRAQVFYMGKIEVCAFLDFGDPVFMRTLGFAFLCVLLCLGAALAAGLIRREYGKSRVRLGGLLAGIGFLAGRLVSQSMQIRGILMRPIPKTDLIYIILPVLAEAAILYLACMAVYALCNMKAQRVKLRGIGLVWAWLAAAGAAVTIIAALSAATSVSSGPRIPGLTAVYTFQLIVGLSALAGYILLLCKRRVGLFMILLGVGLMLCVQLLTGITAIRAGYGLPLLITTLLGALNPLFAGLAVRAADR